ncbi:B12-binding domain-containing radical SAM protein [Dapis sp. BLCC M126]|uniref:B12-binding domain-containing radical SAM protein n=1 Tax=Dapis sp. BLCC M126 TaxID=3400189 RepID=UPI003CF6FCCB
MRKAKKKISLIQINNSFSNQNYLPYSAGILRSYFTNKSDAASEYQFLPFIYKRDKLGNIIRVIENADVLGLSMYAWNTRISLSIAKAFKEINPYGFVFAGGPSVPDNAGDFLKENPYIDLALHNEGEIAVTILLEECLKEHKGQIPSSTYIDDGGKVITSERATRIRDLEEISSPFLSGVFDELIESNPTEQWIGLWETNRGCPFSCTYCDWGSATNSKQIGQFSDERLEEEIKWFSDKKIEYLFCCDANFGMFPRDPKIAEMVGKMKQKTGYPHALSVQNTKNSTERSYLTQKILCDYGLNKGVTLSMQTLSEEALSNIKRSNIKLSSYFELQKRFIQDNVPTYSDLILGLPGETYESFVEGLCKLVESGQHNRIQFNNLSILPNAEMARPEYREQYQIKTVFTDIVNMHGFKDGDEDIAERQELVVGTNTLSTEEWIEIRSVCWLVAFLYFDKVAQIPLATFNGGIGLPLLRIVDVFMNASDRQYPVLASIVQKLRENANAIVNGAPEYLHSQDWLNIYWPVDEYLFIEFATNGGFDSLYGEISNLLVSATVESLPEIASHYGIKSLNEIAEESCLFNFNLLNLPAGQQHQKSSFKTFWNIGDVYDARIHGNFTGLERKSQGFEVEVKIEKSFSSLDDWLREVVWYGNKRGRYLHSYQKFADRHSKLVSL